MVKSSLSVEYSEDKHNFRVTIPQPSTRYLDEFLLLKCCPDMVAAGLFPNMKEVSESMAAYRACKRALPSYELLGDKSVKAIDVGCGGTPRTAALFAFRTAWDCHAVDPCVNDGKDWSRVERLHVHKMSIEEFPLTNDGLLVLLCVHSHVPLGKLVERIEAPSWILISIPCCIEQVLPVESVAEYEDWAVLSPRRTVKVWRKL